VTWPAVTLQLLESAAGGEIRQLAASIALRAQQGLPRSLLFVGGEPGCGCTTTLLTLARAMYEQTSLRVALVDANPANRALSWHLLGAAAGQPASQNDLPAAAAWTEPLVPGQLELLALREQASPEETRRDFNTCLAQLLTNSHVVLVDGGCGVSPPRQQLFEPSWIDAFILVHRASRRAPDDLISSLAARLGKSCLGLIETFHAAADASAPAEARSFALPKAFQAHRRPDPAQRGS